MKRSLAIAVALAVGLGYLAGGAPADDTKKSPNGLATNRQGSSKPLSITTSTTSNTRTIVSRRTRPGGPSPSP